MNNKNQPDSILFDKEKEIKLVSRNLGTSCNNNMKRKKSLPSHLSDYIGYRTGNNEVDYDTKIKSKNNANGEDDFFTLKKYKARKRRCLRKTLPNLDTIIRIDKNEYNYDLPKSFENYECMHSIGKDNNLIKNKIKLTDLKNKPDHQRKLIDGHIELNVSKCCVCFSRIEGSKMIGPPLSNFLPYTQLSCYQFMLLLGINLTSIIKSSEENILTKNKADESEPESICKISQKYEKSENAGISSIDCGQICKRCFNFMKKGDKAYKQLYDIHNELKIIHSTRQKENLCSESLSNSTIDKNDGQFVKNEKNRFSSDIQTIDNVDVNIPAFKLYNVLTGKYENSKERQNSEINKSNLNNISISNTDGKIQSDINHILLSKLSCIYCKESYTEESKWMNHLKMHHNIDSKWYSVTKFLDFNKLLLSELNLNVQKYMCIACKRCDFVSKDKFIDHLLNDHRIKVNDTVSCQKSLENVYPEPSVDLVHGYIENLNSKEAEQVMITIKSEPNIDLPRVKSITKTPKVLTGKKVDVTRFWNCNECSSKFISEDALNNHLERVGHSSINYIEKKDIQPVKEDRENQGLHIENIKHCKEEKKNSKMKKSTRKKQYSKKIKGKSISKLDKNNIEKSIDSVDRIIVSFDKNLSHNIEDAKASVDMKNSMVNEIKNLSSFKAENTPIQKSHVDECQNNDIITHELIVLECEECGSRFLNHTALGLHMTRIHGRPRKLDKVFSCHMCDYKSPTNGKLKTHLKALHGIENSDKSQCHECGGFYTPNFIKKHIENMHSNKCEHVCRFCNMKFRAVYLLKAHIASEHLNNRWRCDICDQEFDKYHRMRMHKIHQHQTSSFLCTQCDKSFKRKGDLTAHMKRAHMKKEEFKCMYCPRSYLDKGKYRNHLINKHNIPWHKTISKNYCKILRENNMLKVPPLQKKPSQSRDLKDEQERATVAEAVGYIQTLDKVKLDGEDLQNEEHYDIIEVILENQ